MKEPVAGPEAGKWGYPLFLRRGLGVEGDKGGGRGILQDEMFHQLGGDFRTQCVLHGGVGFAFGGGRAEAEAVGHAQKDRAGPDAPMFADAVSVEGILV